MQSIHEFLIFTSKIEHDLEHDSKVLPLFSSPKIYTAKGDLSKRWYLYFSFRNPKTGKLERMANVYGKVNHYKTKEARMTVLTSYRKNLLYLLKQGFNPFVDNAELYEQLKTHAKEEKIQEPTIEETISASINKAIKVAIKEAIVDKTIAPLLQNIPLEGETTKKSTKTKQKTIAIEEKTIAKEKQAVNKKEEDQGLAIVKAFDFALGLKEKEVSDRTIKDYKRKIQLFIAWLTENYPEKKFIKEISRKNLLDYLNAIVLKTSARNRNNFRTELGSIFQVLKNNELVVENYLQSIPVLKSKPERNKTYTLKQQESIFEYLEKTGKKYKNTTGVWHVKPKNSKNDI